MSFNLPSLRSIVEPSRRTKRSLDTIDTVFDDFFYNIDRPLSQFLLPKALQEYYPRMDVSETNSNYSIEVDLPGIKKEDVDIKLDNNILHIKGHQELDKERKDSNFYSRERFYGDFQRSVTLPSDVNSEQIDANFKDGVLTLTIPKNKTSTAKTIDIKS